MGTPRLTARSTSRRTCGDSFDSAEKISTIRRVLLIALTVAPAHVSWGLMSRDASQQRMPADSSPRHATSAIARSFSAYERKTSCAMGYTSAFQPARGGHSRNGSLRCGVCTRSTLKLLSEV